MGCPECNKKTTSNCDKKHLTINDICNPVDCNSNECSESFPGKCILYTGDDILCNDIPIMSEGDSLAQGIANAVAYFCSSLPTSFGKFSQINDSDVVSDLSSGSLVGPGQGTLIFSADTLYVGNGFNGKMAGKLTLTKTQTVSIYVRLNGIIIASTPIINATEATNKNWTFDFDFAVRSLGLNGELALSANFKYMPDLSSSILEGSNISEVVPIDTTINNNLDVGISWGSNEGGLSTIYSQMFTLNKTY